jgi:hypothetical protein
MRITLYLVVGLLAFGVSSCNNPAPPAPAATPPAPEAVLPANDVVADPMAVNAVIEAPATNSVGDPAATNAVTNTVTDDPRGLPDRREENKTGEGSEPK